MLKNATNTVFFEYRREEGINPCIGFMSFQHFNTEPIYSDCVVLPENRMCETEDYECYPIPEYVKQKGFEQGFYPDSSIAYIRFLWKEFEPERGKYNYDFVQEIIDKAKSHNQTLMLRLMAHSTRSRDDVPEWLKGIIDCPERPDGTRVKDSPTDPLFIKLFGEAIRRLGEKFDSEPVLAAMDISLPGAWGEGHKLELYSQEDLEKLFDIYFSVFKNTRLIGQVFKPELIERISNKCSVGVRADGFGEPSHLQEIYPPAFQKIANLWQTAPISFESYWWLGEWKRKGWDIDEIIKTSLQWHISSFNGKSLPIPFEWKEKINAWIAKMGYHFVVDYFKFPDTASKSDEIELKLGIDNVGVAPMYDKIPCYIKLKGDLEYELLTEVDVTKWLPGKSAERIILSLPNGIKNGKYDIEIGIYGQNYPFVYFATNAVRDERFYIVGRITIK